mmetsp:Transcript_22431/g.69577  ORF Transcript_22431/g.69577 Transcript_22431/m.69577 type:complete len:283 (-) Transcript_22431:471-1319(-)
MEPCSECQPTRRIEDGSGRFVSCVRPAAHVVYSVCSCCCCCCWRCLRRAAAWRGKMGAIAKLTSLPCAAHSRTASRSGTSAGMLRRYMTLDSAAARSPSCCDGSICSVDSAGGSSSSPFFELSTSSGFFFGRALAGVSMTFPCIASHARRPTSSSSNKTKPKPRLTPVRTLSITLELRTAPKGANHWPSTASVTVGWRPWTNRFAYVFFRSGSGTGSADSAALSPSPRAAPAAVGLFGSGGLEAFTNGTKGAAATLCCWLLGGCVLPPSDVEDTDGTVPGSV